MMKRMNVALIIGFLVIAGSFAPVASAQELNNPQTSIHLSAARKKVSNGKSIDAFLKKALKKTISEVKNPSKFPKSTKSNGRWKTSSSRIWTSGFFPGLLWYMYERTGDKRWRKDAERWTLKLDREKRNATTHDIGFKVFLSFGHGYRLTGKTRYRNVVMQAARTLATRYNPKVGCIRSWDRQTFPVIIDNMMNLELLFWAARNGGKEAWYDMAVSHALKTMQHHVRSDGSTYHIVDFNPKSGKVTGHRTDGGYTANSTWSRGQAWAIYGFTMSYRETGNRKFLDTAQRTANYFIKHLPKDAVPYWDFDAPQIPREEKDASAAAIAASGLLELSTLAKKSKDRTKYRKAALKILKSLTASTYLAKGSKSRGLLKHAVGSRTRHVDVDVSLIYADYYFVEALTRKAALGN